MKPGKYGELIRWICDAEHRYVLNGIPWTKRPADPTAAELHKQGSTPKNLVLELTSPFHGTGRNITGDRFFSGVPLCEELLFRHRLTYLGTLMSNKREIPPILHRSLEEKDSVFVKGGKNDSVVLCSYQAKSKNKVLLISSSQPCIQEPLWSQIFRKRQKCSCIITLANVALTSATKWPKCILFERVLIDIQWCTSKMFSTLQE